MRRELDALGMDSEGLANEYDAWRAEQEVAIRAQVAAAR